MPIRQKLDLNMSTNFPILNYEFALNQLGGNEALLSKMLGKFLSEFENISAETVGFIEANDIQSAKMLVHTVKGISGNIGLQSLYDCATRFDAELRTGIPNQAIIDEFRTVVGVTCLEIQQMEQNEAPKIQPESSFLPKDKCKSELIERLKRNEFIDDDTLFNYVAGLDLSEPDAKLLTQLIEELQYPKAIAKIEENT
ncbi:MAG: HPt (histidine-containing phosphotransfer) domain-containing protein [Glaciecola sp.]|jgi:HPt (histidine-containing phosphotransfer) domain-containing protein